MQKMDSLTHFLSKNIYNDVLCINVSKVTAHKCISKPKRYHLPKVNLTFLNLDHTSRLAI